MQRTREQTRTSGKTRERSSVSSCPRSLVIPQKKIIFPSLVCDSTRTPDVSYSLSGILVVCLFAPLFQSQLHASYSRDSTPFARALPIETRVHFFLAVC